MRCIACRVSIDTVEFWTQAGWSFEKLARSLVDDDLYYLIYLIHKKDDDRIVAVMCPKHAQPYMFQWLFRQVREARVEPR